MVDILRITCVDVAFRMSLLTDEQRTEWLTALNARFASDAFDCLPHKDVPRFITKLRSTE
jgi:hypothetical protein